MSEAISNDINEASEVEAHRFWFGWFLPMCVAVWGSVLLFNYSDTGVGPLTWFWEMFIGGPLLLICSTQFLFSLLGFVFGVNKKRDIRIIAVPAAGLMLFGLFVAAIALDWPFRLRFELSEKPLRQYAEHLTDVGQTAIKDRPRYIGFFEVREAEKMTNCVRLIISRYGMADDAGLVYCPEGQPPVVGEDHYTHIEGPWWHWHRSW